MVSALPPPLLLPLLLLLLPSLLPPLLLLGVRAITRYRSVAPAPLMKALSPGHAIAGVHISTGRLCACW
jgi:hypothetical protein